MKMDEMMLENERKLLGEMFDSPELINSGATGLLLLLTPKHIYLANSGDSKCFIQTKDGRIAIMNKEHKPDSPEEKEWIEKAGGEVVEGRINESLNVSRSLGDFEFK